MQSELINNNKSNVGYENSEQAKNYVKTLSNWDKNVLPKLMSNN